MAIAVTVDIFDQDGDVLVRHIFYGKDEREAEKWKRHHLEACAYFRAADAEGRTAEFIEEIDDEERPREEDYEEEEAYEDE